MFSPFVEALRRKYLAKGITLEKVTSLKSDGVITEEEFNYITQ
ncbi:hypothetical protein N4T77_19985 [Clostridium sp. CX1]|nr:hypothetical protein [Clostridium sp. CX1]MCT8978861.1 hypothetical protein [Clostridium sp. CX1]